MNTFHFPPPDSPRLKPRIQPVFIPFQGCPMRCVFCAQTLQTGESPRDVRLVLSDLAATLDRALANGEPPRELAFYGGTFTSLPVFDQFACLELAIRYQAKGLITGVRASTRPDALSPSHLNALRKAGLGMLELGIQSFSDIPLTASQRGYSGTAAITGCRMVRDSGLTLGIQLMPGMPGMLPEHFILDLKTTLAQSPAAVRLYPCLVLAGTPLAALFERGEFTPWSLKTVIPLLADAQTAFWQAGITVIRIGLAPQDGLDRDGVLAGSAHPALGSIVRSIALFRYIRDAVARLDRPVTGLAMPRRFQGEFWGHKGKLKKDYAALGITPVNVQFQEMELCELICSDIPIQ